MQPIDKAIEEYRLSKLPNRHRDLTNYLRARFNIQMNFSTKNATLSGEDAADLAYRFGVAVQDVKDAAKRFGVLVDDPYATKVTDYTKKKKSPYGRCYHPDTGEVYCEANHGEQEDIIEWGEPSEAYDDGDEPLDLDSSAGDYRGYGGAFVGNVLDQR